MKRWAVVVFWLFFLLLRLNVQANTTEASSSTVRVPQDYPTIQAAINAVQPEGTILVSNGTYKENIVITNKTLQLIGENKNNTIIEGAVNGTVELVNATNVLIKGFTIKNIGNAAKNFPIRLHFANKNRIEDCNLIAPSPYSGVWLEWSHGNTIKDNNITNNGDYGVYLFEADNNTIADNTIATDNGILFSTYCENNTVTGNIIITSNKTALHLYTCSNNTFYHNSFINMTRPVFSIDSVNFWDNGFLEGNYWSAYGGSFNLTTGIGLTPYVIDANNQDDYPLMKPYVLGDANHDSIVNIKDATQIGIAWNTTKGTIDYNPHADLNMDTVINTADADIIRQNWQKTLTI